MSIIFLSLWEYIVGVILEKLFKTKYWDYSDPVSYTHLIISKFININNSSTNVIT